MAEIDPKSDTNKEILDGKNTEACEQLNAWINERTACSLSMGRGHFGVYWDAQFDEHNKWLMRLAQARRNRFAAGGLKHNPDKAKQSK